MAIKMELNEYIHVALLVIDTAGLVRSVKRSDVHPSVCPIYQLLQQHVVGLLLSAPQQEISIGVVLCAATFDDSWHYSHRFFLI